jgi:glucose-6-phosphate 1-epimerase
MTATITAITGFGHLTDLPCLRLEYARATAVISLYGGQVLSYQPQPEQELLWLSTQATWHNQSPIRGGVPICWPWFGPFSAQLTPQRPLDKQQQYANHGVVRNRLWQLEQQHVLNNGIQVELSIMVNDLPYVAGSFKLRLTVTLTESLDITLNCDSQILQQAALHTYFNITDLAQTTISPLPQRYQDSLSQLFVNTDSKILTINQEVDRIYAQSGPNIQLANPSQHVLVQQQNHDATVVWNPWQEKFAKLTDTNNNDYLNFVCIESARLTLTASPLTLSQTITKLAM